MVHQVLGPLFTIHQNLYAQNSNSTNLLPVMMPNLEVEKYGKQEPARGSNEESTITVETKLISLLKYIFIFIPNLKAIKFQTYPITTNQNT